jgi:hypothetical protein
MDGVVRDGTVHSKNVSNSTLFARKSFRYVVARNLKRPVVFEGDPTVSDSRNEVYFGPSLVQTVVHRLRRMQPFETS